MALSYTGVYINLDRSTARRAAMEAQISKYGLQHFYRRLPAAEGNTLGVSTTLTDAETGCIISHYLVCKQHVDSKTHLHVVEDDVLFSGIMHQSIRSLIASPRIDEYDILFLDSYVSGLRTQDLRNARRTFDLSIVRGTNGEILKIHLTPQSYQGATTSYLIRHQSIPKLLAIYEQAFADGLCDPVDIMLRKCGSDGRLRMACMFPFLTSVRLNEATTINDRQESIRQLLAMDIMRHSFFVDRDIDRLLSMADNMLPTDGNDAHLQLLAKMLGVLLAN